MENIFDFVTGRPREWEILAKVALAMLLGGVVGFERETASKPAGFRTHMLVAGVAALLVGVSFTLVDEFGETTTPGALTVDPIRILQAIIIGVSFLGAGTIVRGERPNEVQGLTTGASLLMSSGIGITIALRQPLLAIGVTLLVTIVLRLVGRLEDHLHRRST